MTAATVAGVYASALLELADEHGNRAAVVGDCTGLLDVFNADILAQLDDTRLGKRQVKASVTSMFSGKIEHDVLNLLLLLIDRNRLGDTIAILKETVRLADVHAGMKRVLVTSASPMSATAVAALQKKLRDSLGGAQVELTAATDPALIGGMTFRIDDTFFDGSVRRHLGEMRRRMLDAPIPAQQMWVQ